jgi:hypothetical protein
MKACLFALVFTTEAEVHHHHSRVLFWIYSHRTCDRSSNLVGPVIFSEQCAVSLAAACSQSRSVVIYLSIPVEPIDPG